MNYDYFTVGGVGMDGAEFLIIRSFMMWEKLRLSENPHQVGTARNTVKIV